MNAVHRVEIYERWAPQGGKWSLWVTPALFSQIPDATPTSGLTERLDFRVPWAPDPTGDTGLVIDLPGEEAIWCSLALAGQGYRPVPVYEASTGPHELIDQEPVIRALANGAAVLGALSIPPGAPPVFVVDARRDDPPGGLRPAAFDNRWRVSPFDFPTADVLRRRGVSRILLVQRGRTAPRADMARVLSGWQNAGIAVVTKDVTSEAPPRAVRGRWRRAALDWVADRLGSRSAWPGRFGMTE